MYIHYVRYSIMKLLASKAIQILASVILFNIVFANSATSKDITDLVSRETDLDEKISSACSRYCQGNRRRGDLVRFLLDRIDSRNFLASAEASLRNRHRSGLIQYDYTIIVIATGTLDSRSCLLTIKRVRVENDQLNIGSLAREQEGKVHHIEECQKFISGL